MFKLRRYLRNYRLQLIVGPICKLIEAIFELIIPLITADIIDVGVKNNDINYVINHGILMILMGAFGLCFALICQKSASIASQGFGTELRSALFKHINSFSYAELDKIGTPSLITRMTNDINQLQLAVAMVIRLVVRAPFLVVGAIIMSMTIDFRMSIIFLVTTPLIAIVLYAVMNKSIPYFKKMQKNLDKISLLSRENLSGNRVIRAFNKQSDDEKRFANSNLELVKTSITAGKISALLNPLTYIIAEVAIISLVWFGAYYINIGELKTGQIVALVNYMTQILLAMIVVSNLVVIFTKASASAARVNEVFETKSSVIEKNKQNIEISGNKNIIEFNNVSFGYENNGYALKNINFAVEENSIIGIIGGTGSGKSTLVNLIPRFYDANEGNIKIYGKDIKEYSFKQLRNMISIVPQKPILFTGTIRNNMCWRKKDVTDQEIECALKISQSYEFVSKFPEKINKYINAEGKNLSGGQRQRLTIARALIGNPKILILDDSASALDFVTESKLRKSISENIKNMTVFMVSQRVSTVRESNKIIVIDNGKIVGIGTHDELIKKCIPYKEICLSQLKEEEI